MPRTNTNAGRVQKLVTFNPDEWAWIDVIREKQGEGPITVLKRATLSYLFAWWHSSPESPFVTGDWGETPEDQKEAALRVVARLRKSMEDDE